MSRWGLKHLITSLLLIGCATNPAREFEKIKIGMEKDQVLDLMGSPKASYRKSGQDHWAYVFYDGEARQEKYVHFESGKTVYVGDLPTPALSAEQRDQINEEQNQALLKQQEENKKQNRLLYEKYESDVKGDNEIRYVPKFEPVQ